MRVVLLALGLCLLAPFGLAAPAVPVTPARPAPRFGPPPPPPPPPLTQVRQDGPWTLYSRDVNRILCADTQGGETWLGTALGVKRLDQSGKALRFYTRRDGLPGDFVLALAAEPREAWSVVLGGLNDRTYFLCHLDRVTDRWETLREVPVPEVRVTDQTRAPLFIAAGARGVVAFSVGDVARSTQGIAVFLWDRRKRSWTDVPWDSGLREPDRPGRISALPFPEPGCLLAQRTKEGGDNVLIGTYRGLERYDVGAGVWQTLLPHHDVVGGVQGEDGGLWLAAIVYSKPKFRSLPSEPSLRVVRLDPETGAALSEDALPRTDADKKSAPDWVFGGVLRTIVPTGDGALWLVAHRPGGFFSLNQPVPTVVQRFDTRTRAWQTFDLDAETGAGAPPAVWGAALVARVALTQEQKAAHLPGWSGPADLPDEPPPSLQPVGSRLEDADVVWTVEGDGFPKNVLTRTDKGGTARKFPLPDTPLPMTPSTEVVTVADGYLLAVTSSGLWQRLLPAGPWRQVLLPTPGVGPHPYAYSRLIPAGRVVLIQTGQASYRYRPATGQLTPVSGWPRYSLLAADEQGVWLADGYENLYRAPASGGAPVPVPFSPLPTSFTGGGQLTRFGFAAGRVWYTATTNPVYGSASQTASDWGARTVLRQPAFTRVIGYDPTTKTWTEALRVDGLADDLSFRETPEGVYLSVGHRRSFGIVESAPVGDLYRYDLALGHWYSIAPPTPGFPRPFGAGAVHNPLRLAFVDAQNVWLLDPQETSLWQWSRVRQAWMNFPSAPPRFGYFPSREGLAVRDGGGFYVGSARGLWRFDIAAHAWMRLTLPVPISQGLSLSPSAVDERGVWALASGAGPSLVARFDKAQRTWRLWGEADGLPRPIESPYSGVYGASQSGRRLVSDGVSALLQAGGRLYRLNPQTDRWEDVFPALLRSLPADVMARPPDAGETLPSIARLIGDRRGAWLRLRMWVGFAEKTPVYWQAADRPVLVHWDSQSAAFTGYAPPPVPAPSAGSPSPDGTDLLVEDAAVWVSGGTKAWRLDRRAGTWQALAPPPDFLDSPSLSFGSVRRGPDGALWVGGGDALLRWSGP